MIFRENTSRKGEMGRISVHPPVEEEKVAEVPLIFPFDWIENVKATGVVVDRLDRRWIVDKVSTIKKNKFGAGKIFFLYCLVRDRGNNMTSRLGVTVKALENNPRLIVSEEVPFSGSIESSGNSDDIFAPDFNTARYLKSWFTPEDSRKK